MSESNILNFNTIWESILFENKLDDAYRMLTESLDAKNVIVCGFLQRLGVWRNVLAEKSKILHQIEANDDVAKTELLELQNQVDKIAADVLVYSQDLIQNCSAKIIDANNQCLMDFCKFQIKQDELKLQSKMAFENCIVKKFQNWRLKDVVKLQNRIQQKLEGDEALILSKFAQSKKKQLQECEILAKLQEKITDLRISLLQYPLNANRRIRKYDQKLFVQKETIKILQKQLKFVQKGTEGSLSRSTSRKTSKDTQRTKLSEGMKRRQTVYEQIFKNNTKQLEKPETGSSTTAEDEQNPCT